MEPGLIRRPNNWEPGLIRTGTRFNQVKPLKEPGLIRPSEISEISVTVAVSPTGERLRKEKPALRTKHRPSKKRVGLS